MTVDMEAFVLWHMVLSDVCGYRRFRDTRCNNLQGRKILQSIHKDEIQEALTSQKTVLSNFLKYRTASVV
jgi:hypothetical protein